MTIYSHKSFWQPDKRIFGKAAYVKCWFQVSHSDDVNSVGGHIVSVGNALKTFMRDKMFASLGYLTFCVLTFYEGSVLSINPYMLDEELMKLH